MHQSPLATRRFGTSADGLRAVALTAALAALATLVPFRTDAQTQPQPPAPAPRGGIGANLEYPVLPIGSPLPDFNLPGVDGKNHKASEYSGKALAIVFESNHCPVSQLYEERIEKLYADYKNKGVTLVAINPNNPKTVRLDELGYTDVTDSLPEMKLRAQFRGIDWPYLYDGDTQGVSMKFGAVATPHIFIFDDQRKLRYQGRIDDNQREDLVKSQDARNALDAVLAGKPVPVAETRAFGCTTKWLSKASGVEQEWARIQAEPVNVEMVDAAALKELRANNTEKVMLVHFWSTGCALCTQRVLRPRVDLPHVPQARLQPGDGEHERPCRFRRRAERPEEGIRLEPQQTVRERRSRRAAGGVGREMEPVRAADDGHRAGRQRALPEGREVRHPRGPSHHTRRHARHQRLHRIESVLDARRRRDEEEARHPAGAGFRRREKIGVIHVQPVTLERDGIRLEPLTPDHEAALIEAAADGRLWDLWFTTVPFPDAMAAYISTALQGQRDGHMLPWAVRDAASGDDHRLDPLPRHRPGHRPRRDRLHLVSRRAGSAPHVNTTCKLLLLAHAFDTLGCKVVGLRTDNFNFRSQRAIEGLGAKKDGVLRHHAMRRDGSVRDSVMYSILAAEWPDVRRHLELRLARHAR